MKSGMYASPKTITPCNIAKVTPNATAKPNPHEIMRFTFASCIVPAASALTRAMRDKPTVAMAIGKMMPR